jgi:hypothetical protein
MRNIVLVLLALSIGGCVEMRRQQMMENASKNCDDMGFKKGTTEHSNCQLDLVRAIAGGNAARPTVVVAPSAR